LKIAEDRAQICDPLNGTNIRHHRAAHNLALAGLGGRIDHQRKNHGRDETYMPFGVSRSSLAGAGAAKLRYVCFQQFLKN